MMTFPCILLYDPDWLKSVLKSGETPSLTVSTLKSTEELTALLRGKIDAPHSLRTDQLPIDPLLEPGEQMVQFRTLREISQAALAELVGVDVGTINRWENGQRSVPKPIQKLIHLL
jgi:DNA-binding transcriptional regulator YiaG